MSKLPAARLSPRIENGMIKWYRGDTFQLSIHLELEDQDGESIAIAASAQVDIHFTDRSENTVKEFSFTGIEDNTVTLDFDSACTALFPKGEYRYRILYTAGERSTVAADNLCIVE